MIVRAKYTKSILLAIDVILTIIVFLFCVHFLSGCAAFVKDMPVVAGIAVDAAGCAPSELSALESVIKDDTNVSNWLDLILQSWHCAEPVISDLEHKSSVASSGPLVSSGLSHTAMQKIRAIKWLLGAK